MYYASGTVENCFCTFDLTADISNLPNNSVSYRIRVYGIRVQKSVLFNNALKHVLPNRPRTSSNAGAGTLQGYVIGRFGGQSAIGMQ